MIIETYLDGEMVEKEEGKPQSAEEVYWNAKGK